MSVIYMPNSILRQKARAVSLSEIPSKKIRGLIENMKTTLRVTPDGVGLAAPQVGELLQIFIVSEEAEEIDRTELKKRKKDEDETDEQPYAQRDWKYYVFINPMVKKISRKKLSGIEGCLSVPGKFGPVLRQEKITVEAYDETGEKNIRGASRFFARVLQHELDHLTGNLFIDKAEEIFDVDKNRK